MKRFIFASAFVLLVSTAARSEVVLFDDVTKSTTGAACSGGFYQNFVSDTAGNCGTLIANKSGNFVSAYDGFTFSSSAKLILDTAQPPVDWPANPDEPASHIYLFGGTAFTMIFDQEFTFNSIGFGGIGGFNAGGPAFENLNGKLNGVQVAGDVASPGGSCGLTPCSTVFTYNWDNINELDFGGSTNDEIGLISYTPTAPVGGGDSPVPEPVTFWLVSGGLIAIGSIRRKCR